MKIDLDFTLVSPQVECDMSIEKKTSEVCNGVECRTLKMHGMLCFPFPSSVLILPGTNSQA